MSFLDTSKLAKSDFEVKKKIDKQNDRKKSQKSKVVGKVSVRIQVEEQQWGEEVLPPAVGIICGPNPFELDKSATFQGFSPDLQQKGPEKARLILKASVGEADFLGDSQQLTNSESQVKYSVGIYDKNEKTLKLMPILGGNPIAIRPRLKSKTYGDEDVSSVFRFDQEGIKIQRKDEKGITYEERHLIWQQATASFSKKTNPDKKKSMEIKVERKSAR